MLKEIILPFPLLIKDLGMLYRTEKSKSKARFGLYKCSCGKEFKSSLSDIKSGNTKSCGCYRKQLMTKHGMSRHEIYGTWKAMIERTSVMNHKSFKDYGGRGITVCDRWKDVVNFIEDMYPTFQYGLSIDRIDPNGNYELQNCRWATKTVQQRNTRKIYSHNTSGYRGVVKSLNKWKAYIRINTRHINIGSFSTPLEAAKAYDTYVIKNNLEHTINGA